MITDAVQADHIIRTCHADVAIVARELRYRARERSERVTIAVWQMLVPFHSHSSSNVRGSQPRKSDTAFATPPDANLEVGFRQADKTVS